MFIAVSVFAEWTFLQSTAAPTFNVDECTHWMLTLAFHSQHLLTSYKELAEDLVTKYTSGTLCVFVVIPIKVCKTLHHRGW